MVITVIGLSSVMVTSISIPVIGVIMEFIITIVRKMIKPTLTNMSPVTEFTTDGIFMLILAGQAHITLPTLKMSAVVFAFAARSMASITRFTVADLLVILESD